MAPDRTDCRISAVGSAPLPPKKWENPMKLTRLAYDQHPPPPQRDLRQRGVFDPDGRLLGHVDTWRHPGQLPVRNGISENISHIAPGIS